MVFASQSIQTVWLEGNPIRGLFVIKAKASHITKMLIEVNTSHCGRGKNFSSTCRHSELGLEIQQAASGPSCTATHGPSSAFQCQPGCQFCATRIHSAPAGQSNSMRFMVSLTAATSDAFLRLGINCSTVCGTESEPPMTAGSASGFCRTVKFSARDATIGQFTVPSYGALFAL